MKGEIDFLKFYKKELGKKREIAPIINRALIIMVGIYCLVAGGIFFYWGILNKTYSYTKAEVEAKKARIKQQEKKESLYFLLKKQLSSLSQILSSSRKEDFSLFYPLLTKTGGGTEISEIKISSGGQIEISATSTSPFELARFLEETTNSEVGSRFSQIILKSLSKRSEGGYSFSMVFKNEKN